MVPHDGAGTDAAGDAARAPLRGKAAIFIAAWQEDQVIGHTIRHALSAWRQDDFTLYVGCYGNDAATVGAAMEGAGTDARVRVIIHERAGPTTKADCLNRLYRALCDDERQGGRAYRCVILHDAEQVVSVVHQKNAWFRADQPLSFRARSFHFRSSDIHSGRSGGAGVGRILTGRRLHLRQRR